MDDLDIRIIKALQQDPRQTNKRLAHSLDLDKDTVSKRINKLIDSGAIILTALPNLQRLGSPVRAFFLFQVEHNKLDKIAELLSLIPNLRYISYCAGFADFFARGEFSSLETLADFITNDFGKIDGIQHIDTMIEHQTLKTTYDRIDTPPSIKTLSPQSTKVTLSDVDYRLICLLQKNSRATLKELADGLGVSLVTVHRRIKELVDSGLIELTAVTNPAKYGYPLTFFFRIETEPSKVFIVAETIAQYHSVAYVGMFIGERQILAGVKMSSAQEFSDIMMGEINKIDGIVRIETLTSLKILKQRYTWL